LPFRYRGSRRESAVAQLSTLGHYAIINLFMKTKNILIRACVCSLFIGTTISIKATDTPILISCVPTNNAQDVPIDTAVSFTFNEPMFTGYSIDWGFDAPNGSRYWTKDQKTFIVLSSDQLPPNTEIDWELNPPEYSPSFQNLAGTPLPAGLYQGSFTTGTNVSQLQVEPVGWSAPKQFHLRIVGTAGEQVVVYGSTNLINWIPLTTNNPAVDPIDFTNSPSPFPPQQFYKASVISTSQ